MQLETLRPQESTRDIFKMIASHEQIVFCNDPASGLQAIIAIHDTTLGPALGGTRMYPYKTVDDALVDVLRLSEGMTYKCAATDIDFGGGKGVIIGDPNQDKTPAMFRAYGQFVDSLNGRFYTGTDMGTTMDDFVHAAKETPFINGLPEVYGGGGDSSIPTAKGVIYGLEATNMFLYGTKDFVGRTYAIQGLGKVGFKVAKHLLKTGANIYVTDIYEETVARLQEQTKDLPGVVYAVEKDAIYDVAADVFVPCAMGGVLNDETINRLNVKAVVGSANNQLQAKAQADQLDKKGILYAPDYIVNAGGLIQVADELYGPNPERVMAKTESIYDAVLAIYDTARRKGITTNEAADMNCQQRIKEQQARNNFFTRGRSPKWTIKS
ncbi:Leu/Phe/Val dehydrogenase [Lentibacillus saliphilus]|uniref:Leu/Phe/Val dehydrogenase n=1 Tax=Lentibacillus saliphilus TaxID=2737028 RepID=UPI001C2F8C72|nr:Glu/Leu/Phe/Val dehydrogenase [Lentibacillus saliphilus]